MTTPTHPKDLPIACRPATLDKAQRQRQQELLDLIRSSALAIEELSDG